MAEDLLPLFPLQLVALPKARIPLHIFEERYKEMVGDALARNSEFGIVLATEQGIVNVGCTVFVEKVLKRYEDGRMDILCQGSRRFEIVLLNEERQTLRASVHFFDDEEDLVADTLREQAVEAWRQVERLLPEDPLAEPDLEEPQLSFQLARRLPDLNARQVLLQIRSEEERLRQLIAYFNELEKRQARVAHIRRVAPTNGHSKSHTPFEEPDTE